MAPARYVTPIPDCLSDVEAAPFLCAGVTVYAALRKTNAKPGDYIAIVGAGGGLGHLGVQMASRGFSLRVIGIDAEAKSDIVKECGADHFIGLGSKDKPVNTVEEVKKLTNGEGVHAVLTLASANGAYASTVPMLRYGGRVVCVGLPDGDMVPIATAYPGLLIAKELSIVGSAVGNRKDAIETLDMAARGLVKLHSRTEPLEKLKEVSSRTRRDENTYLTAVGVPTDARGQDRRAGGN